jgi:hypothetical protein
LSELGGFCQLLTFPTIAKILLTVGEFLAVAVRLAVTGNMWTTVGFVFWRNFIRHDTINGANA